MPHLKQLLLCSVLLFMLAAVAAFTQEAKNALLIANGEYGRNMGALSQPVPEARELKSALESIGFNVTLVQNVDLEAMQKALAAFKAKTQREGGYAFFHYGGHAVQIKGVNYLIPLRATLDDEEDVLYRCLRVDELMQSMKGDTNIIVFDSAFTSPFIASSFNGIVNEEMANSIIVYSAIPGTAARDGLFTPILTKRITEKGRSFYDVLQEIRKDVHTSTGGEQRPFWYGALFSDISLTGFDR